MGGLSQKSRMHPQLSVKHGLLRRSLWCEQEEHDAGQHLDSNSCFFLTGAGAPLLSRPSACTCTDAASHVGEWPLAPLLLLACCCCCWLPVAACRMGSVQHCWQMVMRRGTRG